MPIIEPITHQSAGVPDRISSGGGGAPGLLGATAFVHGVDADYRPGSCNIGPAEITIRRRAGHVGAAATLGLLAVLLASDAPRATRLLVALPATGAASGYLQARHRFCAGYGSRGVVSFGAPGDVRDVVDPGARALDKATARRIGRNSALVGLTTAVLALALPRRRQAG